MAQHTQRMSRESGNRFSEEDMRNQKILGCRFIGGFMSKLTLIKNGTIITVDPAISDLAKGDLLIEDGRIAQVAPQIRLDGLLMALLKTVAVLAPLSAAQYAWITLRKVQAQSDASSSAA